MESLWLLIAATGALLGSPGPATIALAATGATFGPRRGVPFLAGLLIGLAVVVLLGATGVTALLSRGGAAANVLTLVSLAYLVYVAYKISSAPIQNAGEATGAAPSLRDGVILNLTNVKAYAAFSAIFAAFSLPLEDPALSAAATGGVAYLMAVIIDIVWLMAGGALAPAFAHPRLARPLRAAFAITMLVAVFSTMLTRL